MPQQQSWLIQTNRIKTMIGNSEMKHKAITVVGAIRYLLPDLVSVNEKVPFTCNFNHREQQQIH